MHAHTHRHTDRDIGSISFFCFRGGLFLFTTSLKKRISMVISILAWVVTGQSSSSVSSRLGFWLGDWVGPLRSYVCHDTNQSYLGKSPGGHSIIPGSPANQLKERTRFPPLTTCPSSRWSRSTEGGFILPGESVPRFFYGAAQSIPSPACPPPGSVAIHPASPVFLLILLLIG